MLQIAPRIVVLSLRCLQINSAYMKCSDEQSVTDNSKNSCPKLKNLSNNPARSLNWVKYRYLQGLRCLPNNSAYMNWSDRQSVTDG